MIEYLLVIAIFSLLGMSGQPPKQEAAKATGCLSAKAMTGASPGRINVTVKCTSGEKNQPFNITIARYPLNGHAPPGIKAFRHRPPLVGSGGGFAHCRRVGRVVRCEGRAREHVRMLAVIYVRPATRCRMGVSVTSRVSSSTCRNGCPLSESIRLLFTGPPKGCGA
jgi:hypothetical protein